MLQDATTIEISCFLRAVLAVRNNIDARVPQVGDQIFVLNLQLRHVTGFIHSICFWNQNNFVYLLMLYCQNYLLWGAKYEKKAGPICGGGTPLSNWVTRPSKSHPVPETVLHHGVTEQFKKGT